jgi:hypothetical protein
MELEPGANISNTTRAMILCFASSTDDVKDLQFQTLKESPYIDINPPANVDKGK